MRYVLACFIWFWSFGCGAASAENFATLAEAEAMMDRAAAFVQKNGVALAAQAFVETGGGFRDRDLYVSMSRVSDGVRLSHFDPRMIGRSIAASRDADGKPYGEMIRAIALADGAGRLDYRVANPVTGKPMQKTGLIRRVGEVILVVGAYR
ncbi:hypothetical protein [Oleispirillum naphthae]|uniref:cache domain-containing protein n=1 Tax=Oleispirillum naphthae TaxID=2838853 RepID=UPI0030824DC0